jgi:hypothetical protein
VCSSSCVLRNWHWDCVWFCVVFCMCGGRQGLFFFNFCDVATLMIIPQQDSAKFGYWPAHTTSWGLTYILQSPEWYERISVECQLRWIMAINETWLPVTCCLACSRGYPILQSMILSRTRWTILLCSWDAEQSGI